MRSTLVFLAISSVSAYGGSIYFTNFGSDATGNLIGQDNWSAFNGTSSFATVENTFTDGTPQAAELGPNVNASVQTGMYHTDTASGSPIIDLNADLYIFSSSQENNWQFAALGSGLAPFIGGINLVPTNADLGTTDSILAITGVVQPNIGTFALNAWNDVDLLFNFSTQTYTISLNGTVLLANTPFCGTNSGPCLTSTNISEGQFLSFFDVFATVHANAGDDLGAVDNWSLSSVSSVPEPGTYALTGIALLAGALALRRR